MVAKWKIQDQSPEPRSAWLQSQSRLFYIASKTELRVSAKWNSSSAWRGGGGPRECEWHRPGEQQAQAPWDSSALVTL